MVFFLFSVSCLILIGHLDALLRGLVLGKLGKTGHKATLEEARKRFKDHVDGNLILSADLRSPVRPALLNTFIKIKRFLILFRHVAN